MEEIRAELVNIVERLQANEERMENMANLRTNQPTMYEDIITTITSGEQIQLESYRSIPEFNGDKNLYRSWRNQVSRRMSMIEDHKTHPKYEAALGIIRSKIVGPASDVLTNNKTAYNIDAILDRLDSSYADQRPLYIVEAEMTSIKQLNKTLQEYYDAINQALNLIISKIVLTYGTLDEQKSLIAEAQQKAIRTFIIGLKSNITRNVLYSQKPNTLAEAFTTAQTVFYDNQYLHLEQNRDAQMGQSRPQQGQNFANKFKPGMQPQAQRYPFNQGTQQQAQRYPANFNVSMNCNQPPQKPVRPTDRAEPMEVDSSNRFNQNTNWRQPNQPANGPQKREYDSSRQHQSQPNKMQRINQLEDEESNPHYGYEGDICDTVPDELSGPQIEFYDASFDNASIDNTSTTSNASAFLSE